MSMKDYLNKEFEFFDNLPKHLFCWDKVYTQKEYREFFEDVERKIVKHIHQVNAQDESFYYRFYLDKLTLDFNPADVKVMFTDYYPDDYDSSKYYTFELPVICFAYDEEEYDEDQWFHDAHEFVWYNLYKLISYIKG